jgi:hypothetical protein
MIQRGVCQCEIHWHVIRIPNIPQHRELPTDRDSVMPPWHTLIFSDGHGSTISVLPDSGTGRP